MSTILRLDKITYDLWLSYSWSGNNQGICGHTFEVIDYYLLLKKYFRVGILLAEDIDWPTFKQAITSKYDISLLELEEIQADTVFFNRPKLVTGNNILFTDGGVTSLKNKTLLFDNIFHFSCGDLTIKNNKSAKTFILQDERIYGRCLNSIDYKKKIYFSRYKKIISAENNILLYGTKNCRNISLELYYEILNQYHGNFICLTNESNRFEGLPERFRFLKMPVDNLFEMFTTYIYTPIERKFDCSPRLIAECKFYGKNVIYHKIDYWDEDRGLYYRKWDIDNDFDSICLNENDEIIDVLKKII
ncbi:MAG: hypothetical protein A2504_07035 [Bdellovibrionales bacterium RIFOXYD12_FULL_39_22]|nr:MAG: hypothetical protein A2385_05250 [Bdellovibrionales bacterium RIFOXYB1_FULL_39_21]OFZ44329.1 MAG: hypothetical protein A2485_16030 [Bdellovibrionales bacterium RIFOXYC12_FULL_39_17]OFZ49184.1 MAG: hypothetical protein A2404_15970 [Bdellovibrionales bacterium RIFOXYC1_FULL_39_130]OFZ76992.1 MAG: hypothetical protein A2560_11055 [Bdellovibrionales bacterium RIFOXYD1_FULL_39_84]OFZ95205.1 MAG: hypothetical protein A2504_07035 [Bdellovibrionales bacterium RIFOXYD12_FULL_39_22]HLE09642.1 hy